MDRNEIMTIIGTTTIVVSTEALLSKGPILPEVLRRAKLDTYCFVSYTDSGLADRAATIQLFVQADLSPYFSMGLRRASPSNKKDVARRRSYQSSLAVSLINRSS